MSTAPPPPPYPQPSYQPSPYGQPEKSRSGCGCILMGLGGLAVAGLVVCVGCAGFVFWSMNTTFDKFLGEISKNAVIQEHIGEIQEKEIDWSAAMSQQGGTEQSFRMKVKGPKGEGTIVMRTEPGKEPIFSLDLPSGESIPLEIKGSSTTTETDETAPMEESPEDQESADEMPVESSDGAPSDGPTAEEETPAPAGAP